MKKSRSGSYSLFRHGYFLISKKDLVKFGIISVNRIGRKCAFRVYAPWVELDNLEASRSQKWQQTYFCEL